MKKELEIYVFGFLLLFSMFTAALIKPAQPQDQEAAMYIDPEVVTINQVGKNFSVYVKVRNVEDVYLWQVAIRWNASILECTNITLPENHIFAAGDRSAAEMRQRVPGGQRAPRIRPGIVYRAV